ncbi:MAG: B12-binding domain-containing radical SAM protein [Candidatus Undinarchaeales archaeon]|jgi:radical SAM superfamily enzyme YgiQ (UPF0313 family)|nr:B12-binding domain-containing radical SAM protein [Candidatus Undinarchaeales archaeon]MDP7491668.1 B12-binding domain-containing radical SAM protein [Candidatus Undinarchaeales archaeon]
MGDVLLLNPPPQGCYQFRDILFGDTPPVDVVEFPVNLASVASSLLASGCSISVLDANALQTPFDDVLTQVEQQDPDVIVIPASSTSIEPVLTDARAIREVAPDTRQVLMGLIGPSLHRRALDVVDAISIDDHEEMISDLLSRPWDPARVDGLIWSDRGRTVINPDRPHTDLDALPFPARHLFPLDLYIHYLVKQDVHYTNMVTSRGCVHRCTFCSRSFSKRREWRGRSPANVADEFQEVSERLGIREFRVIDEDFLHDRDRVLGIAREMRERDLDVNWVITARADGIDKEIAEALASAGCFRIDIGVESANPDILRSTGKGVDLDTVSSAFSTVHEAGIAAGALLIVGLPGETWESVAQSVSFAREVGSDFTIFRSILPYPDTPLHTQAVRKGWLDENGHLSRPEFTADDVKQATTWAYRTFYLDPAFMARRAARVRGGRDARHLLRSFGKFLKFYKGLG